MRPELSADDLPASMRQLPLDERGYPVPWFVAWENGKPEFRAMDPAKRNRAVKEKLCWVCGGALRSRLGFLQTYVFVIGPMCAVNRVSSEPPSHMDCAVWSAKNCPFLSRPHMRRREDDFTDSLRGNSAGIPILRNPGVTLVWPTTSYSIFQDPNGKPLFRIGDVSQPPQWWAEGRLATREEVMASIESGLPFLREACGMESPEKQPEAFAAMERQVASALKLVPAA